MIHPYTLTDAKARLSSIVGKVENQGLQILITRKGKNVAVLMPFAEYRKLQKIARGNGLMEARGALRGIPDRQIEAFIDELHQLRQRATERAVAL